MTNPKRKRPTEESNALTHSNTTNQANSLLPAETEDTLIDNLQHISKACNDLKDNCDVMNNLIARLAQEQSTVSPTTQLLAHQDRSTNDTGNIPVIQGTKMEALAKLFHQQFYDQNDPGAPTVLFQVFRKACLKTVRRHHQKYEYHKYRDWKDIPSYVMLFMYLAATDQAIRSNKRLTFLMRCVQQWASDYALQEEWTEEVKRIKENRVEDEADDQSQQESSTVAPTVSRSPSNKRGRGRGRGCGKRVY